jgi:hypothetical protein
MTTRISQLILLSFILFVSSITAQYYYGGTYYSPYSGYPVYNSGYYYPSQYGVGGVVGGFLNFLVGK